MKQRESIVFDVLKVHPSMKKKSGIFKSYVICAN